MSRIGKLTRAQQATAKLAKDALADFWRTYSHRPPAVVRDALLELMPALVEDYGKVAATAAAEWYEEARQAALGGNYRATVVIRANLDEIERSVRWAAGDLFADAPGKSLEQLNDILDRHVKKAGRETIDLNVARDPAKPTFARVPFGPKTCAFCEMLASRGFVYRTAETAGALKRFHGSCDCQIVPDFSMTADERAAHDAETAEMFNRYAAARDSVGDAQNETAILSEMRRQNPGHFTDSTPVRPPFDPDPAVWLHILRGDENGGGHLFGAEVPGKTQFPEGWGQEQIAGAAQLVVDNGRGRDGVIPGSRKYEGMVDDVVIWVTYQGEQVTSTYPLRGNGVTRVVDGERVDVPLQSRDRRRYNHEREQ